MIVIGINWYINEAQVITDTGTRNCRIEEGEDDFYFRFKGEWHSVSQYGTDEVRAQVLSHRQGISPVRQGISQDEFENICRTVLSRRSNIIKYSFEEPGVLHVTYPSHSGKSWNGSTLYFGDKGYITSEGWSCSAGSNEGRFIGDEISRLIQIALYNK